MKKILILTVTAGNAHNACAMSMKRELEESAEVKVVDLLKCFSTKRNVWIADGGYNFAVSRLPKVYNAFYNRYRKRKPFRRYSCPPQKTILSVLDGLLQEILSFRPDVIYCTHFYGAIALTDLNLAYPLPCKTVVSTLDYVNSPFWEAGIGVDHIVIPNEDFTDTYRVLGYSERQLLPFGIPVDGRTLKTEDKKTVRRELGLNEETFTATVMFGGGHWRGGYRIFTQLEKSLKGRSAQIVMINGRDEKSFRRIAKRKAERGIGVLNVGYTDQVPRYLSAADVVINKCGGGSSTEIINKAVPMLVTEKLAAQEKYNLEYLKNKGVALSFRNKKELKKNVLRLIDDPALLERMSENTLPLRKNATGGLADFILSQPTADYSDFLELTLIGGIDLRAKKWVRKALKEADKKERTARKRARRTNKF